MSLSASVGPFCNTRLLFGVASAPAIFQPMMEAILRDLPHVCVYLADVLFTGESEAAHVHNLTAVLQRLESAGIKLNREKCAFMLPEVSGPPDLSERTPTPEQQGEGYMYITNTPPPTMCPS